MVHDNKSQREKKLQEYLITMHMLCLLLMVSSLVLGNNLFIPGQVYPIINIRFFVGVGLVALAIVYVFKTRENLYLENINVLSPVKAAYLSFPLLMGIFTLMVVNNNLNHAEIILLLPVLVAASITGKTGGLVMSTLCTLVLIFYSAWVGGNLNIYQTVEADLLFIGMMYIVGWFGGALTGMEAGHRRHLIRSMESLQEEISSRLKAEEELRVLSCAVEQSPVMVIIADTGGRIRYVNNGFTRVTGYSLADIKGREMVDFFLSSNGDTEQLWELVKSGREWEGEITGRKKEGEIYWEIVHFFPLRDSHGRITHILKFAEDITEKKQMEKEMARLERLNLVGEMAAGLGHEIRNPMTTVRGFLQLMNGMKECPEYKEYLDLMIQELDRANSIIEEYLSLARDRPLDYKMQNLTGIVETMVPLIRADVVNSGKKLELDLQEVPDLLLDEKEIRQLLLNLVRNGLDAMEPGGKLTVSTMVNRKAEVVLAVKDRGCGIAPDVLDKIGTPFFTTKEEGTGLGMAVCFSIAARHNAKVKIDTGTWGTSIYVVFKKND